MSKEYFYKIEIKPEHRALCIHAEMHTIITGVAEAYDSYAGRDLYVELVDHVLENIPEEDERMIFDPDFWQVTALNLL